MDRVQGPGNLRYESQHLQVSRRLHAESVKPNVFKETGEDVSKSALNLKDMAVLSPEAKELLKQLRKEMAKGKGSAFLSGKEDDFESLLGNLKKLKRDASEQEDEDGDASRRESKGKKLLFQQQKDGKYVIPLTTSGLQKKQEAAASAARRESFHNAHIIEAMLVKDTPDEYRKAVIRELDVLGEKMLTFVKSFGTHIIILERNCNLTQKKIRGMMIVAPGERSFDGRPWEVVRGIYCPDRRLIVAGEELLGKIRGSVMRHEFGHAFDHAFTKRNQRRLPLSVQLWNSFEPTRKALPSQYAATNPAEYFAESVDAFFIADGRQYLADNDPQMYEYLDVMFNGV